MTTANKNQIFTKTGKVNQNILNAIKHCRFTEKTSQIHTGYYSGSNRYTTAHSAIHTVKSLLSAQGYKFTMGNDAPNGGITGEYLKVSKVAFNFIKSIKSL